MDAKLGERGVLAWVLLGVFFVFLLNVGGAKAEVYPSENHPVDLAMEAMQSLLDGVPDNREEDFLKLTGLLEEVPRDLPKGGNVFIYCRGDEIVVDSMGGGGNPWSMPEVSLSESENFLVRLWVNRDNAEGPRAGWDFYWWKYLCIGPYYARMPYSQGLAVHVLNSGEVSTSDPSSWFRDYNLAGTKINVSKDKALEKARKEAEPVMRETGVNKIDEVETLLGFRPTGSEKTPENPDQSYRLRWDIQIWYDKEYPSPDGLSASQGYQVGIWADTGEITYSNECKVMSPPPEQNPSSDTENKIPTIYLLAIPALIVILALLWSHRLHRHDKKSHTSNIEKLSEIDLI